MTTLFDAHKINTASFEHVTLFERERAAAFRFRLRADGGWADICLFTEDAERLLHTLEAAVVAARAALDSQRKEQEQA